MIALYGMALLAAVGLSVCFPVAGPAPRWLTATAFVGASPLLVALVGRATTRRRYLWESWLLGWCFGTAWYGINCYWIYATMRVSVPGISYQILSAEIRIEGFWLRLHALDARI